jgi:hypothetical protein
MQPNLLVKLGWGGGKIIQKYLTKLHEKINWQGLAAISIASSEFFV